MHVDHAGRKARLEGGQRRHVAQHADAREFHHERVAHDEAGDGQRVGLVQRVVERTEAQDDAERGATNLMAAQREHVIGVETKLCFIW